jgi:hypothetical protein
MDTIILGSLRFDNDTHVPIIDISALPDGSLCIIVTDVLDVSYGMSASWTMGKLQKMVGLHLVTPLK